VVSGPLACAWAPRDVLCANLVTGPAWGSGSEPGTLRVWEEDERAVVVVAAVEVAEAGRRWACSYSRNATSATRRVSSHAGSEQGKRQMEEDAFGAQHSRERSHLALHCQKGP
jgi:hypothetical protein